MFLTLLHVRVRNRYFQNCVCVFLCWRSVSCSDDGCTVVALVLPCEVVYEPYEYCRICRLLPWLGADNLLCTTHASLSHVASGVVLCSTAPRAFLETWYAFCAVKMTDPQCPVVSLTDMSVSVIFVEMKAVVRMRCVGVDMATGPACVRIDRELFAVRVNIAVGIGGSDGRGW